MTALFIDTSYDQILGLLDNKKSWIDSKVFEGQKLTGVIHNDLDTLLKKNSIHPQSLDTLYFCAGPGFYTGLRVAYGIADIFRLHNTRIQSFYSYLIPQFCGIENYLWLTKAYRGEIFIFDSVTSKLSLKLEKGFTNTFGGRQIFTHSKTSIDESLSSVFQDIKYGQDLVLKNPEMIFSQVKTEEPLYYFRPLDEEYKPSL